MLNKDHWRCYVLSLAMLLAFSLMVAATASVQGSVFTYQGRLTDGENPADGIYDIQFKLFNSANIITGVQQGPTITLPTVQVTKGVFSVQLDFGLAVFDGSARFLEIAVRPAGSPDPYAGLLPRQPLTSAPYAVRSLTAAAADTAASATSAANSMNAAQLGGIAAGQYVVTTDARLSDARPPTAGSTDYVQNRVSQQASTNFNISGNGTLGGTLTAATVNASTVTGGTVSATTQYTINGLHALSAEGSNNIFVGSLAGASNTTGFSNAFFGRAAGFDNTSGGNNSFFGRDAGFNNITGTNNSFFGAFAGVANTANDNSFFGRSAGTSNTTGTNNAFFGRSAGINNTFGSSNSFFGRDAGEANTGGSENSFFGYRAGFNNTAGGGSFFGAFAGAENTGPGNSFFGRSAGALNTSGFDNSFFGHSTGGANTIGFDNAFFGRAAGLSNTSGSGNSFFGRSAGFSNTSACCNSFFGQQAGFNTTGGFNSIFGTEAGKANTTGLGNAFFGYQAGLNSTGSNNSFFGIDAGESNMTGSSNTIIGANADVGSGNLSFATAIGAGAVVTFNSTVVLGRDVDTVRVPGQLAVNGPITVFTLGAAGATPLCRNANQIASCSSSLRYKDRLAPFTSGLDLINRLRPITFSWKQSGERDLGFAAEEVAAVEPLLATYNSEGKVEGVKYDRITVALVNAVREQQSQILRQDEQIASKDSQINMLRQQNAAFEARLKALEQKLLSEKSSCLGGRRAKGNARKPL